MEYHISKQNKITTTYKFYLWSIWDAGTKRKEKHNPDGISGRQQE